MKKLTVVLAMLAFGVLAHAQTLPYKDASKSIDERVEDLLSRMTLEEKIMQLNQYMVGKNDNKNNIGVSLTKIPPTIGSLIYIADDAELRNSCQKIAMEQSRLGIPILFGYDAIHGFRTIVPIPLAQACSWNPELVRLCSSDCAAECRAAGIEWTFSPMVDVAHDPRWGRVSEGYGEDPYTASVFCKAAVEGYQGAELSSNKSIAACLKHYVGYGASEAGRDYVYTEISRQTLWDTYLPPFKAGVDAGARTLMSAFNNISGVPASANHYTMTEVLKQRWNFGGFIVSDWDAIKQLVYQGMAEDHKKAAELAFNAGLDMDMVDNIYFKHMQELVDEGKIKLADIDESVRRVLRVKFELGLFENPYTDMRPEKETMLQPEARANALQLTTESMVLLKNENSVLPLSPKTKIALVGPLADNQKDLLGCWRGRGKDGDVVSVLDGMKKAFPKASISYTKGCEFDGDDRSGFTQAVDAAKAADVVVLCIGEQRAWSGENASRGIISLPDIQEDLLTTLKSTDKRVIVVVGAGRPIDMTRIDAAADAILYMWAPGIEGGNAVANLLSGKSNPSGRLAMTFPYTQGQIPIYYNRRPQARRTSGFYKDITSEPLYPFGYGLSYSQFSYGPITVDRTSVDANSKIRATVTVTNTSKVDGQETVFWYIKDKFSTLTRPVKELKYFEKQLIKAGKSHTFVFEIDPLRDLAFVDCDGNPVLEAGEFEIMAGPEKVAVYYE